MFFIFSVIFTKSLCLFLLSGMRGSTPLDVAAASCIDNNELALALQEQDLEMVCMDYIFSKKKKSTVSSLNLPVTCVLIGGDVLGRLWAANVSDAPF